MKSASSTEKADWLRIVGVVACVVLIVFAFYIPTSVILPEANGLGRWAVWILGYLCGCVVMAFTRRLP